MPSALNNDDSEAHAPSSSDSPTMPLRVIITAANTVSRASDEASGAAGEHQRHNERDLDDGDSDGEHQRAERLTDPVGDQLGMVHGGEHGPGDQHAATRTTTASPMSRPHVGDQRDEGDPGHEPPHAALSGLAHERRRPAPASGRPVPLGRLDHVGQEHGPGHRPDPARVGADQAGDLPDVGVTSPAMRDFPLAVDDPARRRRRARPRRA